MSSPSSAASSAMQQIGGGAGNSGEVPSQDSATSEDSEEDIVFAGRGVGGDGQG